MAGLIYILRCQKTLAFYIVFEDLQERFHGFNMDEIPFKRIRQQRKARLPAPTTSFRGKTIMITGANGDFGSGAAQIIAEHEVDTLILACRNIAKGEVVKTTIEAGVTKEPRPKILVWELNLASFDSVREFGKRAAGLESLDAVILNAAIFCPKKIMTPEGWETTIQVNYLANMLLALLLLPALKSSPTNSQPPILTTIASWSVYTANFSMRAPKSLSPSPASAQFLHYLCTNKDGMAQQVQYGRSKNLCHYFFTDLASRIPAEKVIVNAQDPGTAWTGITQYNRDGLVQRMAMRASARPVEECVKTLVHAVSVGKETHGKLMVDYDIGSWPKFMTKPKGKEIQKRIWEETRIVLEGYAPEVAAVYASLDGPENKASNGVK